MERLTRLDALERALLRWSGGTGPRVSGSVPGFDTHESLPRDVPPLTVPSNCRPAVLVLLILCVAAGCARSAGAPSPDISSQQPETRLVFAEHSRGTTIFWAARPEEPADRRQLARVNHDPEWGIRASVSPTGGRIAYTAMPPGSRDPDGDAVLVMLDLAGRTSRRLATGIDLRITPVWLGGDRVVVQRRGPIGAGTLVEIASDGRERPLVAAEPGHRLFPIDAGPDGTLYVADLGPNETRLRAVDPPGSVRDLGALGDGPARSFALAPDGSALAYLCLTGSGSERRYRAHVLALQSGVVAMLRPDVDRTEDTGVVWAGDGFIVSTVGDGVGTLLGATPGHDRARPSGFDAAAEADPDGRWIAVRAFAGGDPQSPGPEELQLVGADGRRTTVSAEGGATAIGWTRS
jgi:hypothetical protein